LELLIVEILRDEELKTFSSGLAKFFKFAVDYLRGASLTDPANDENIIDAYLDEDGTRDTLLALMENERQTAEKAYEHEKEGDDRNAVAEWKKILENARKERGATSKPASSSPTIISQPPKQHGNVRPGIE
jgi:hypothetical protein